MTQTVGFIGAGNIARCLIAGLINSGWSPDNICVSDPDAQQREKIETRHGIKTTEQNTLVAQQSDLLALCVKPQIMQFVCKDLADTLQDRSPLILSVAAGIRVADLKRWLGKDLPIVRVMPNTPALLGFGASGLFANSVVNKKQKTDAEQILNAVGITRWVPEESAMDAVTAISGSGPAYFFLLMEALESAATKLGLEAELARDLIAQTAIGAAYMMRDSGKPPGVLRDNVTSPGGTTAAAMKVFEQDKTLDALENGVLAANQRAEEMATALGGDE